ncbi:MAG TPA: beta-galactosidase GalB [Bryobacteraceae bacterium]|nr:beta-galactosidase GalB [Bryobacteraceae bacterium]
MIDCRFVPFCALALLAIPSLVAADRRVSFNEGWRFFKGEAAGAEQPGFNDSAWRALDLPHDWAIEGPFDSKYNPETGGLPICGIAWYRKHFAVPADERGKFYSVMFDGAMSNSTVWLNGHKLGGRPYGYSSFELDLTPYLNFGQENVIAVRLAPEDASSRWYPGAGIYRNVWLVTTGPVHVVDWGTYVTTPEVLSVRATIAVRSEIRNRNAQAAQVTVETVILDAAGKQVGRQSDDSTIPAGQTSTLKQTLLVPNPLLWDVDRPYLYRAVTTVKDATGEVDRYVTPFGIRTIEFNREKGFLLNGRHLKIHGVCNHHDLGALGAAVNRRAIERQLQIMKAMGANAIRTSHNPPAPVLLNLCDHLGLLVIDEAFDMWRTAKVPNGYSKYFADWGETDLRDMIRRDRNHPSIILWSIGNEIPEQSQPNGWQTAKFLTGIAHQEDPTRPTTAGFDQWPAAIKNGLADQVDVPGFNYKPMHYEEVLREHPKWAIYGSETSSCVSSRGVYHLPIEKYRKHPSLQISSYDIISPPWAYCPDVEFEAQDRLPNVLGEFVWTGFDYLGEPTPYGSRKDWPSRSSYFGIVDLAGFPKDRYYLYQSVWTSQPMVHVLPHWNWAGREGQAIPVMAYTNAEEVELFVNGKSLGRKKRGVDTVVIPVGPNVTETRKFTTKYRLEWDVPYQPGTLRAVAYNSGAQVAADEVHTAGAPARIRLIPDRAKIHADGQDLSFITVRIEDQDGNLCPLADNLVQFKLDGAGRIEAVDNGNAATVEPFQADHRKAFSGMALLIVRSYAGREGSIQIEATSEGLQAARVGLNAGR